MSLMGNVIWTVRSTGFGYWAAYVGGEKIKTDGLKRHKWTDVIPTHTGFLQYERPQKGHLLILLSRLARDS